MSVFAGIRKRRLLPWMGAFLAAGFIAIEGVDQLVSHGLLPEVSFRIVFVFYLFGIPGTLIAAWFHGEKGTQKPEPIEFWLHGFLLVAALTVTGLIIRGDRAAARAAQLAAESDIDPTRVAVLYFEDFSADGELGYLADAMTEALIDRLSRVRALDVISRNGVTPFRGSDSPRDSIARALGAGSLIEGSIEPHGQQLRVVTRLVDGASGADIARSSFELPADQLLAARDSVAESVTRVLRQRLGEEVRLRETRGSTESVEAWSLVQRAERLRKDAKTLQRSDVAAAEVALQGADSMLASAEVIDPDWVEPPLLRARIGYDQANLQESPHDALPYIDSGREHVERALAADASSARALAVRGMLNYQHWELRITPDPDEWETLLEASRDDLEAAVAADPTLADAHIQLSFLYYDFKDVPAALLAARRAYEEDAYLSSADDILWRLFFGSLDLEQFAQARRWCAEGARRFQQDPRFSACELWLMATPALPADVDRAWELQAHVVDFASEAGRGFLDLQGRVLVAGAIARAGMADSARAVLMAARKAAADSGVDPHQDLLGLEAYIRSVLQDYDEAIDLLKSYVAANPDHAFEQVIGTAWWWREVRNHPRINEIGG